MNDLYPIFKSLLVRLVLAVLILWAGWHYLVWSFVLVFPFVILLAAIIIARPLVQLISLPAGSLFFPNKHFDKPQPVYGIPEARRKAGNYEEALAGYDKITDHHPDEVIAWIKKVDIALNDLRDPTRAESIYGEALARLKKPEHQDILRKMYIALQSIQK